MSLEKFISDNPMPPVDNSPLPKLVKKQIKHDYDYIEYGKSSKYFVTPPRIKEFEEVFSEDVKVIAKEKIADLSKRRNELEKAKENSNKFLNKSPETRKRLWFQVFLNSYQHNIEVIYIDKWIRYWKKYVPRKRTSVRKTNTFSQEQIEHARAFPLEDLVEGDLKYAGSGKLKTCCPFHSEKTPSFIIYTEQNTAHCYGCSKHIGGAIDYLMETEEITFPEAVKQLI